MVIYVTAGQPALVPQPPSWRASICPQQLPRLARGCVVWVVCLGTAGVTFWIAADCVLGRGKFLRPHSGTLYLRPALCPSHLQAPGQAATLFRAPPAAAAEFGPAACSPRQGASVRSQICFSLGVITICFLLHFAMNGGRRSREGRKESFAVGSGIFSFE